MKTGLETKDFFYSLPAELIAQDPLKERSASRLLVLRRETATVTHQRFSDLPQWLRPGDCLVRNDTRVLPARLFGRKEETGARIEVLLLKRESDTDWECLVRPGKKCKIGSRIIFSLSTEDPLTEPLLVGTIVDVLAEGNRRIRFSYTGIFEEILDRLGEMPLPPYITHPLQDRERYQTVYAAVNGSAAAPTAGLHFTGELLEEIEMQGVSVASITLHVGLGTFRPVKTEHIQEHHMHSEYYAISEAAAETINRTKREGGRVICIGTTSCRTLETASDETGVLQPGEGWTDIFIYPGYRFKMMDGLITNFHLPESTLLMLVSAFAGREAVLDAYAEAIRKRYRFFSFGDAMLII